MAYTNFPPQLSVRDMVEVLASQECNLSSEEVARLFDREYMDSPVSTRDLVLALALLAIECRKLRGALTDMTLTGDE